MQAKKFRCISDGVIRSKSGPPLDDTLSTKNFKYQMLDDDYMEIGGYMELIKGCANKKYRLTVSTEFVRGDGTTGPAPFRGDFLDMCEAFLDKKAKWYPFTKLWTDCPPKKGVSY